ncbi:hypothetical protein GCM10020219_004500 [Nonomuraea dietziae]
MAHLGTGLILAGQRWKSVTRHNTGDNLYKVKARHACVRPGTRRAVVGRSCGSADALVIWVR